MHRQRIGEFQYSDHCVASRSARHGSELRANGASVESLATYADDGRHADAELMHERSHTPRVVALRGDGTGVGPIVGC